MNMPQQPEAYIISPEDAGQRLDIVVSRYSPGQSRSKIQKLIENNGVVLSGIAGKKNSRLKAGDTIAIDRTKADDFGQSTVAAQNIPLEIIYEDEHLLAVNKPAGMVVHPGNGNRGMTMVNALLYHIRSLSHGSAIERPGIVHRLDKDTSGVILVAKTDTVHSALARMFFEHTIEKQYIALCVGLRPAQHAVIDMPLGRNRRDPIKRSVQTDGKNAVTEYWLLHHACGVSVMDIRPHTGRTHQIRVHFSSHGFPILCDPLYGGGKDRVETLAVLDRPKAYKIYKCFTRHALHARKISFKHPVTHEPMALVAPFPEDFLAAFNALGIDHITLPINR
jgi:23S rRNA pseudouridine1911/1915/1917 synthase